MFPSLAFQVVANYYGNRKQFEAEPGVDIHWAGDRESPPPDTPTCGFDGSKCPPDSTLAGGGTFEKEYLNSELQKAFQVLLIWRRKYARGV